RKIKCKARIIATGDDFVQIKGEHICINDDRIIVRDVQYEMRQLLEVRSLGDLRVVPTRVWRNVKDEIVREHEKGAGLKILAKSKGIGIVKRCRNDANGGDVFRAIET
ncbi:hypothetical protein PHYSODRAFT_516626, partial [Phytophthora sojae]